MSVASTDAPPALPLVFSDEETRDPRSGGGNLRRARRSRLPPPHRRRRRAADRALERARREGLPRRQPPRALRRRRARHARAAGGRRGDLRRRLLAAADRRLAGDRRLDHHPPRDRGPARAVAAGNRGGDDEGRVRDHRARRGHELAQPLDDGAPRRRLGAYVLRGTKTFISGVEDADAILVIARKREADGVARAAAADARRHRLAGAREAVHPGRGARRPTSSGRCSSTTSRCRPTASSASPRRRG